MPARRPSVAFIAWTEQTGRATEIAEALGGEAWQLGSLGLTGPATTLLRYPVNAARTLWRLAIRRPRSLIVQNPPLIPGLLGWLYSRVTRTPIVLDSHPASFGLKAAAFQARLLPLHAWLARRSALVLVTVESLAEQVRRWGGRPLILHEAPAPLPPADETGPAAQPRGSRVLYVGVFAPDEPLRPVLDAAAQLPDVRFEITGDPARRPDWALAASPGNVAYTGFLRGSDYVAAIRRADAVLVLTTEDTSVVRAGYEAVYAERPLIVSDTEALRDAFPHAVHVANDAAAIADGVRTALERLAALVAVAPRARVGQLERWQGQLDALRAALTR